MTAHAINERTGIASNTEYTPTSAATTQRRPFTELLRAQNTEAETGYRNRQKGAPADQNRKDSGVIGVDGSRYRSNPERGETVDPSHQPQRTRRHKVEQQPGNETMSGAEVWATHEAADQGCDEEKIWGDAEGSHMGKDRDLKRPQGE